MSNRINVQKNKIRRQHRVRTQLSKAEAGHPRLSVFRSNTHIYAQIIDDKTGKTIVAASSLEMRKPAKGGSVSAGKVRKSDMAKEIGKLIAERAKKAGVSTVVFDRGSYRYHGRVKSLAEGAREGSLKF